MSRIVKWNNVAFTSYHICTIPLIAKLYLYSIHLRNEAIAKLPYLTRVYIQYLATTWCESSSFKLICPSFLGYFYSGCTPRVCCSGTWNPQHLDHESYRLVGPTSPRTPVMLSMAWLADENILTRWKTKPCRAIANRAMSVSVGADCVHRMLFIFSSCF